MPINKETIISVFNEKLTLEQWLKTINKALDEAVLTGVEIAKKGNATLSFKFTFEDGTFLESNDLVLQQGESVQSAYIQNGHLYLVLTNGTNLDAGNIKPVSNFSIDANQHLIVNYADGTSQDLGAIFQGNINISGDLNVTGSISAPTIAGGAVTGDSIIENMSGYSFASETATGLTKETIYASACKNGNKITFVIFVKLTKTSAEAPTYTKLGAFTIPWQVGQRLYPYNLGGSINILDSKRITYFSNDASGIDKTGACYKRSDSLIEIYGYGLDDLVVNTPYVIRYECTFLLSDNLAQ